MVFPATPRELVTEMFLGGVWLDVSADVRARDQVRWTWGKSDRSSSTSPGTANFTMNNGISKVTGTLGQTAVYSPRNPLGPYYGLLTRNTPIRQRLRGLPAPAYDASSNAAAGTGPFSWTHTGAATATGVLVWVLQSGSTTLQTIDVTYGGVVVPLVQSVSTNTNGRLYSYHLGTGVPAGSQTVTVTPSAPGPTMRPVAVTVTGGNATELNNGPLPGSTSNTNANPSVSVATTQLSQLFGVVHSGQDAITGITAGTGYTDVLEHDFGTDTLSVIRRNTATTTSPTTVSWTATADTWTAAGFALSAVAYRFWGELSDLPLAWDITATDADAAIQAGGVLRRINQGDRPIFSALREYLANFPSRSYWPLDDGSGSATGRNLGADTSTFYKSGAWVPTAGLGTSFDGDLQPLSTGFQMSNPDSSFSPSATASVRGAPGGQLVLDYVYRPNIVGDQVMQIRMNGLYWLNVRQRHDGVNNDFVLEVQPAPSGGGGAIPVHIADSAKLFELVDYQLHHVRATFIQTGGDVNATIYLDGVSVVTGLISSMVLDVLTNVAAYFTPQLDGAIFTIGHVAIWDDTYPPPPLATAVEASQLWLGELAADRLERLCVTAGFPTVVVGNDSIPMGQQGTDYFSNQLTEIEATDRGMLYEPRDQLAVGYRTRASMYNQDPTVTASFTAGELAPGFSPIEDDAQLANDVFAQRRNGGSFQATKLTGPLSVQAPPQGVGRYKDEIPVNVQTDDDLPGIAGWLLLLGTVDEPRFPRLRFDLTLPGVVANPALMDALLRIGAGDLLTITGTGPRLGFYNGVSQIVLGGEEILSEAGYKHEITFNLTPAAPYEVGEFGDGVSRFDPGDYSTLNASLTTTATTMAVLSQFVNGAYAYWTTNAAMCPMSLMVAGEEITVTAIAAGAAGVQNFTVARSVNGVVKAHSAGEQVYLKRPTIFGL